MGDLLNNILKTQRKVDKGEYVNEKPDSKILIKINRSSPEAWKSLKKINDNDIQDIVNERLSDKLYYRNKKSKMQEYINYKKSDGSEFRIVKKKIFDMKKGKLRTYYCIEEYDSNHVLKGYMKLTKNEARLLLLVLKNGLRKHELFFGINIDEKRIRRE